MKKFSLENVVEEIKSRCNIVDVVSTAVPLKKVGANHKGLCPFHGEKTPSFVVSEDKQIYTCFGCGATGDVISFVEKHYGLTFKEAVEKLAKEYNIEIEMDHSGPDRKKKEVYGEILRKAGVYFLRAIRKEGNPAYKYILNRGLNTETLKIFGIGYGEDSWTNLTDYLLKEDYAQQDLIYLGLCAVGKKGSIYDKFRNRIMFPIQNAAGNLIGFGGRTLGDAMPKYLNSPESAIFIKKNNLYGLNLAKHEIAEADCGILVEGYMDVVSLYQRGIRNAVASLGTALTERQASLLSRYTKNMVICYDSDKAGINAAVRAGEILESKGHRVRVMKVPQGKDPDEFIKAKGKDAFLDSVNKAISYVEFVIDEKGKKYNVKDIQSRMAFLREIGEYLKGRQGVERELYADLLGKKYGISKGAILQQGEYERAFQNSDLKGYKRSKNQNDSEDDDYADEISNLEKNLLKILLTEGEYIDKLKIELESIGGEYKLFKTPTAHVLYEAIEREYNLKGEVDLKSVHERLEQEEGRCLWEIWENTPIRGEISIIFHECIDNCKMHILEERERELIAILSLSDGTEEHSHIEALTRELIEIQKKTKKVG